MSPTEPTLRLAVAGARGFIGTAIKEHLEERGHTVVTVGRPGGERPVDVEWEPSKGLLDAAALNGVDVVVNVAGEPIDQRWTHEVKRRIRESRVKSTQLLARTCAAMDPRPRALVVMSAVGIYGDRGDEVLDETSALGSGFLAETGRAWEEAADPARDAGLRVVHARAGIVLHPSGGPLARMLPFFQLGVGARVGDGRQWISWITRSDMVRAIAWLATTSSLGGPVNVTSPNPVRNAEFTQALARALHRPAFAAVPTFVFRMLYGEMGEATLVEGQRAVPTRLLEAGFEFRYPHLDAALAHELVAANR